MNDQSFTMGDLRTQLDEIQDVLNRVIPKQESMSPEERQILQKAQIMKNLAEEVVATNLASEPGRSMDFQDAAEQENQPKTVPLTISMSILSSRSIQPTEAPPPTATTPPPGTAFQAGHLRHRSSAASFSSSANSDRQYTQGPEDRLSRPSSVASSYSRHQKTKSRQSLRQLEPLNSNKDNRREAESNAAFDRICSLLTELITDASTAVNTAPDGSQKPNIPIPQFSPLIQSESELSADSFSDEEEEYGSKSIQKSATNTDSAIKETDDPFLRRLQGPDGVVLEEKTGAEVELEPADRYRTGFRSRLDKPSKRLSSLFMELQSTQTIQDAVPKREPGHPRRASEVNPLDREKLVRKSRRSISSLSVLSARSLRPNSMCLVEGRSVDDAESANSCESAPESPLVTRRPRQRGSISSLRSEPAHNQLGEQGYQQVVAHKVDEELDRTVESIDGLTRDLVAVATHQNWMHMRLQKTLQFQKEQIQQIERAHANTDVTLPDGHHSWLYPMSTDGMLGNLEQNHLAELSKSLKQVAVNVGKVLASSASNSVHHRGPRSGAERHDMNDNEGQRRKTRFPGKDFSRYFQELEKIAALGSRIGFGKEGLDGTVSEELLQGSQDDKSKQTPSDLPSDISILPSVEPTLISQEDKCSKPAKDEILPNQARRGSAADAPPELEDFAAQCRLLTRALVLPFVQLTHHAMTSQDSALALTPRSNSKLMEASRDLDSTLEIVQDLGVTYPEAPSSGSVGSDKTHVPSATASSNLDSPGRRATSTPSVSSGWTSPVSFASRDLDSVLNAHGDLSPDAIVKTKAFISTGLYLLHLLYWTVLFVIGTVVLDPWLAETAGQQVVRIVDQVREVIVKGDERSTSHKNMHEIDQQPSRESIDSHHGPFSFDTKPSELVADESLSDIRQNQLQANEDQAIEVAMGFESFRQQLSSSSGNRPSLGRTKSLWSSQSDFQSSTMTLTASGAAISSSFSHSAQGSLQSQPDISAPTAGSSVLRVVNWAGPRRRRFTKDSMTSSRVRRFSNARAVKLPVVVPTEPSQSGPVPSIPSRGFGGSRPLSFAALDKDMARVPAVWTDAMLFTTQPRTQAGLAVGQQISPSTTSPDIRITIVRRKSF
ncbi:hypothetical protein EDD11_009197 [Mortierella claussenii]|nr:hypothetical protein EDD11_009197 [Mortierella claussenii]